MTRKLWHPIVAGACAIALASCSGGESDVRQTGFTPGSADALVSTALDREATWTCGDADLQAVFAPSFTGDALTAAVKAAIADPKKADAAFSFVAPIESFSTDFADRALCMELSSTTDSVAGMALVSQLRSSGNVISVRVR